jgi:hypothetical protein
VTDGQRPTPRAIVLPALHKHAGAATQGLIGFEAWLN